MAEFTQRTFLGYIPGLIRGAFPLNNPPGPGNNAGVRENVFRFDRAGITIVQRFLKIEAIAEFALPGQSCMAVGYYSSGNPAPDKFGPLVEGAEVWTHRDPELIEESGDTAASLLTFTPNGAKWLTIRVTTGTPPTRWALFGRTSDQGGSLAIG